MTGTTGDYRGLRPVTGAVDRLQGQALSRVPLPLGALVDLAAAAGYQDRGAQAEAEFYLGLAMAKLGDALVMAADVAGLLQMVYSIARGAKSL